MPHDEILTDRIRHALAGRRGVTEKAMFGGICFLLNGNMCCGVAKRDMVLRLGEAGARNALREPHVRPMDFTGKPLKTMVYVAEAGLETERALVAWLERGLAFTRTLPSKAAATKKKTAKR